MPNAFGIEHVSKAQQPRKRDAAALGVAGAGAGTSLGMLGGAVSSNHYARHQSTKRRSYDRQAAASRARDASSGSHEPSLSTLFRESDANHARRMARMGHLESGKKALVALGAAGVSAGAAAYFSREKQKHAGVAKADSSALAGVDDIVMAPSKLQRAASGQDSTVPPNKAVNPQTKARLRGNLSAVSQGNGPVAKSADGPLSEIWGISKAFGETAGIRGGVSTRYKPPKAPVDPAKIASIRGKLAPLKATAVLATKK